MKLPIHIGVALMLLSGICWAFDPVGAPPPSTSLSITVAHVTHIKLARVDYPDSPLLEVLDFIRVMEIPARLGVRIDASQLDHPESKRVNLVAKDITILEAATRVAEQVGADILIKPGEILLVPIDKASTTAKPNKRMQATGTSPGTDP